MPLKTLTVDQLSVRIHSNPGDLGKDAAQRVHEYLRQTLALQESVAAILATGNSQLQFLEHLVKLGGLDWSKITLFHMDEYLGITDDHSASFRKYMKDRVESKLKPKAFHYIAGDALEPIAECERYENLLKAQPIDLCCLGIGENGHIAFNDPPVANFQDPRWAKIVKLDEGCRKQQVGEGHFPDIETMPQYAISLTIPALCSAKRMECIVPERRKAQAVRDSLENPISTQCPGSYLRTHSAATLYLDADSASLLRT